MLEREIQKLALDWLHANGIFCWKNSSTGIYDPTRKIFRTNQNMKGTSDILGIYQGKFLAVEVKQVGKHPTEDQKCFLDRITREGGIGIVIHSVDELETLLGQQEKKCTEKKTGSTIHPVRG